MVESAAIVMENFRSGSTGVTELNTARSENDSAMQQYIEDIGNFWTYYYTLRKLSLYDYIENQDLSVNYEEIVK